MPINATEDVLTFSLFNNGNSDSRKHVQPSSGLILKVDTNRKQVQQLQRFAPPSSDAIYSKHAGSMQVLSDGGAFVGYGGLNLAQEFSSTSEIVDSVKTIRGSSYRSYKYSGWTATPAIDPVAKAVYDKGADQTAVYVSWNGATEVASWAIKGKKTPKDSYETKIVLPGRQNNVEVNALNKAGKTIGTTQPVAISDSST